MKPFDLEAAMRGEPIITRDGRKAKFIAYVPEAKSGFRIVVFIEGTRCTSSYYENGRYVELGEYPEDLFMAPPPMRSINGHEFPEPVREPLKYRQEYWLVSPTEHAGVSYANWEDEAYELRWLDRGLIQLTEEGARQQLKAMLAAVGGTA